MRRLAVVGALAACAGSRHGPEHDRVPTARSARATEAAGAPAAPGVAPDAASPAAPALACAEDGAPYDPAVLRARVSVLAAPALDGRAPGTTGDARARAWIVERFRCLGLTPAGDDGGFELSFDAAGRATANVVGVVAGADPEVGREIIVVGAHHDHEGDGHLGANDNASGVVALVAVAQAIAHRATPPRRTIVFATFGGEELGMLGSYHLAAHPPRALDNARIVQFVNLDMVGSHGARGLVAAMGAFRGLAARAPLERLARGYPRLRVAIGGRARGSDFEPYCKLGVPYVFFWTPDHRCYHEACDTAERLDYHRMADIAALAGALVAELAETRADLAAARARRGCGR